LYGDAESEIGVAVSIGVVERARVARVAARPTSIVPRPREIGVGRRASAEASVIPRALTELSQIFLIGFYVVRASHIEETSGSSSRGPSSQERATDRQGE
jgi:hypothetical protein